MPQELDLSIDYKYKSKKQSHWSKLLIFIASASNKKMKDGVDWILTTKDNRQKRGGEDTSTATS